MELNKNKEDKVLKVIPTFPELSSRPMLFTFYADLFFNVASTIHTYGNYTITSRTL